MTRVYCSDEKIVAISNVKKALFQSPSPEPATGGPEELVPPELSDKVSACTMLLFWAIALVGSLLSYILPDL